MVWTRGRGKSGKVSRTQREMIACYAAFVVELHRAVLVDELSEPAGRVCVRNSTIVAGYGGRSCVVILPLP
jgi:hypothetical protein